MEQNESLEIAPTKEKLKREYVEVSKPNLLELQAKVLDMEYKKSVAGLKFFEKGIEVLEKLDGVLDDAKV